MPAGRPLIFDSPEDMQDIIDGYFADCEANDKRPTVSGLAYTLGMTTESLRNYASRDEFFATVKEAKQRVEMFLEDRLYEGSPAGVIFNLKNNFGWKDQQEQTHGVSPELLALMSRLENLDDDELDELDGTGDGLSG